VPISVGGAGSPSNAMWPGPRPTSVPTGILIHPTVWPQYTNVTRQRDKHTDRQQSDSIGRTVLQSVAQNLTSSEFGIRFQRKVAAYFWRYSNSLTTQCKIMLSTDHPAWIHALRRFGHRANIGTQHIARYTFELHMRRATRNSGQHGLQARGLALQVNSGKSIGDFNNPADRETCD